MDIVGLWELEDTVLSFNDFFRANITQAPAGVTCASVGDEKESDTVSDGKTRFYGDMRPR
ncbi:hypothetical protein EYF80_048788 [Liparis tanakae]|uniref:Uncharacterized protein n=1 Tax=Liparis tanakae TaxID=230148 RepID=A0A4Z2FJA5_9TELE|nr:hypothetical protein EYF80_048788 [Liparis tanakae]